MVANWDQKELFPTNLPEREWMQFKAAGYGNPVSGLIYTSTNPPTCGMALGGIGTGTLDLEADGTFGFCSIFNSLVLPRPGDRSPFLGVSVNGQTWVLTTVQRDSLIDCKYAKKIRYWGHFPVADLEYELDAPVSVGLRAWAPFIPGDEIGSNTPGALFEVHVRSLSDKPLKGTVAFTFPGIAVYERGYGGPFAYDGKRVSGEFTGLAILSPAPKTMGTKADFVLGVLNEEKVRIGGGIDWRGTAWSRIDRELPFMPFRSDERDAAASVAVDFDLKAGEEKIVKIVLAWYIDKWYGTGLPFDFTYTGFTDSRDANYEKGVNKYTNKYTERFKDGLEVAQYLTRNHESLLKRIIAWQDSIYTYPGYPIWLKDSLVNILYLIAEDSRWASAKPPVGPWAEPDGIFAMCECPRQNPQMECIGCTWYGHWPVTLFFPKLNLTTLRTFRQFIRPNGQPPFHLGTMFEIVKPTYYDYQTEQNGTVYASLVDRVWQYTGNDAVLEEFYDSVKKVTEYTATLHGGPYGIVTATGANFFEVPWPGIVTYVAGMRLAGIRIAERMAERMKDLEFAKRCRGWIEAGSKILEEKMWRKSHYLLFSATPDTVDKIKKEYPDFIPTPADSAATPAKKGEKEEEYECDYIMANQLDGEWMTCFHGVPGVFDADRVRFTLETLKKTVVSHSDNGVINILRPDGTTVEDMYRANSYFPNELYILAATFMYHGHTDTGIDIAYRCLNNIVRRQGYTWNMPNSIRVKTGTVDYGKDYYQSLMLWMLPLALEKGTAKDGCKPGGIVQKVIEAGKEK